MITKKVMIEVNIEVEEDFNLDELYVCVVESNTVDDVEIPMLKTDYFRVVDYHDIKEVDE